MLAKDYLKSMAIYFALIISIITFIVVVIDPFFHFHKPLFGLSPIQWKKEYQVNGAIDHLDYDALLVGSSVVMNMDNNILDDAYGCESIKAVASGATTDTLYYYINRAYKSHNLKYVFYGIDYGVLGSKFEYNSTQNQVLYLRNDNPFDDIEYILNEDVLFHYIPDMIIQSIKGYDDGLAYNFARYSKYGAVETIDWYIDEYGEWPSKDDQIPKVEYGMEVTDNVIENVNHIEELVLNHPETEFIFFFPVRSILSFDRCLGEIEEDFSVMRYVVNRLSKCDNVTFYVGLFNDKESLMNLDKYCDCTHADYEVNCETAKRLIPGSSELTVDNMDEQIDTLRSIITEFEKQLKSEKSYDFLIDLY